MIFYGYSSSSSSSNALDGSPVAPAFNPVDKPNPCCWRGKWLHHHDCGVCASFPVFVCCGTDSSLLYVKIWYKITLRNGYIRYFLSRWCMHHTSWCNTTSALLVWQSDQWRLQFLLKVVTECNVTMGTVCNEWPTPNGRGSQCWRRPQIRSNQSCKYF